MLRNLFPAPLVFIAAGAAYLYQPLHLAPSTPVRLDWQPVMRVETSRPAPVGMSPAPADTVLARPLFVVTRQMPEGPMEVASQTSIEPPPEEPLVAPPKIVVARPAEPKAAPRMPAPDARYLGSMESGGRRRALIAFDQRQRWLDEGDTIGVWVIKKINADHVKLRYRKQHEVLELKR